MNRMLSVNVSYLTLQSIRRYLNIIFITVTVQRLTCASRTTRSTELFQTFKIGIVSIRIVFKTIMVILLFTRRYFQCYRNRMINGGQCTLPDSGSCFWMFLKYWQKCKPKNIPKNTYMYYNRNQFILLLSIVQFR